MHTVTYIHPRSRDLRTISSPTFLAAMDTARGLRAIGYAVRVWHARRGAGPRMVL